MSETIELTAQHVRDSVRTCLYADGEDRSGARMVPGLVRTFGFHPERLEANRPTIEAMISRLSDAFFADGGGGMSFVAMSHDRDERQWADDQETMEGLLCLAIGIDRARYCLPREFWEVLPHGMPYVQFTR